MEDWEEQKERDRYWNTENQDEERDGEQWAEIDGEDEHQEAAWQHSWTCNQVLYDVKLPTGPNQRQEKSC